MSTLLSLKEYMSYERVLLNWSGMRHSQSRRFLRWNPQIMVALCIFFLSHLVFSFVPSYSSQNGGNMKSPSNNPMMQLSYGQTGKLINYELSVGASETRTKRKKKKKKKNRIQKRFKTPADMERIGRGNGNSCHQTDIWHQDQIAYLKMLDRHPALVLNADYQPLSTLPLSLWNWQETVKSVFSGKVVVVDVYHNVTIRAVNIEMPLPSVIALTEYVPQPYQRPPFTRKNVFTRDGYRCQYCGNRFNVRDLSLDHVFPRCRGGTLKWENVVTCCRKCNERKGHRLPADLRSIGMKLLNEPRVPTCFELAAKSQTITPWKVHPTWIPFLGMIIKSPFESTTEDDDGL